VSPSTQRKRQRLLELIVMTGAVVGCLVFGAVFAHPAGFASHALTGAIGLCLVGLALYLLLRLGTTYAFCLALVAEVFSGYGAQFHLPISPDRILIALAFGMLLVQSIRGKMPLRVKWGWVHIALLVALTYATVSAILIGSITQSAPFFALLDRFGAIPFIVFTLAPVIFGNPRDRNILLGFLVGLGLYLGVTAILEGVHAYSLVFPRYIANPNVGIHFGRARGPFGDAAANGVGMFQCSVAAVIAVRCWRRDWARLLAILAVALCMVGEVFTLTRGAWLGAALGILVTMLMVRGLRRFLVPSLLVGAVAVLALYSFVPGLRSEIHTRTSGGKATHAVWDRLNTNSAAIRIAEEHPFTGIGWDEFRYRGATYQQQALTYPITTGQIEVHNVFLSHLAELGFPGATLWIVGLLLALGPALLRPTTPELRLWRIGLIAVVVNWLVLSSTTPMPYPFCNMFVWLMAGVVGQRAVRQLREPSPGTARIARLRRSTPALDLP
jgi:O-antigen ligase